MNINDRGDDRGDDNGWIDLNINISHADLDALYDSELTIAITSRANNSRLEHCSR